MAVIPTSGKLGRNAVFFPRRGGEIAAPGTPRGTVNQDDAHRPTDGRTMPAQDGANNEKLSEPGAVSKGDSARDGAGFGGGDGGELDTASAAETATLLSGRFAGAVPSRLVVDEDRSLTFEQIHRKYESKIYNLILRLVGDREDAADLTVETFLNAYRAWGRFRGDARVSTWLHQIAVNNCKNSFKQKDRRRDREPVSLDDTIDTDSGELSREIPDWREVPEKKLLDQELARQIQRAVDALAPEYRVVLVLAVMEGLSYEEIAGITQLSVPAVKTRLHRARNMMQRRLEPYYRGWTGRQSG